MNNPPSSPRKAAATLLERWTRPPVDPDRDALRHWQERVLQTVLLASVSFGFFAYVPSLWLSLKEGLWLVAAVDTLIYAYMLTIFVRRDLPYGLRSGSLVAISYLLGLTLLVVLGPFGAGPVWLFATPVFAGLLMGLGAALVALGINAATLTAVGGLIRFGVVAWPLVPANPAAKWLVSSINFMLLDTVAAISLAVLLHGLRTSLEHEKELRASVEDQHRDLTAAHAHLARETHQRRETAEALRESESRLRTILDAVHTGILIVDPETGTITSCPP